ncbi:sensor histidine kinase [Paenibacillus rhizovicinus]|uniref:Sensor histidine kinase n=1 Tax=Paenibacillus rhizovicinus TaxID=2704463 RepID=A0A6C0P6B5_9BACL|nr:sensor histidine kinase [Paenibacillus rhizovicinus]QHW33866.1 sensor histidine kinase [Paenibacillus rhizovicinus]
MRKAASRLASRFSFNNLRLKNQLFFAFFIVVLIPVLFVGIFLTAAYRNNVLEQATKQTTNNVDKIRTQTSDILRIPLDLSDDYLISTSLKNLVNTRYDTVFESVQALWEFNSFKNAVQLYREIDGIRFYTTNETLLENWDFLHATPEIRQTDWYRSVNDSEQINWRLMSNETKQGERSLSLVRRINFPEYKTAGVLVIDVNQQLFNTMLSQEPYDTMILDSGNNIVAAKDRSWIGRNLSWLNFPDLAHKGQGTYRMSFEGKQYQVVIEDLMPHSSETGLRIVSLFAVETIVGGANRVAQLGFTVLLVSMVIALVLIYFMSSVLTKRTLTLYRNLSRAGKGDLTVVSDIRGNDEIALLSRQFNTMLANIRRLLEEVEDSNRRQSQLELAQKDIKLKMMASQINPHFLFNALESIRMRIHMKGEKDIASVVRMLGRLIRNNIEIGSRSIPLGQELEIVRYYLEIQQFRYGGDRLTFSMELDEGAQSALIPPLIIQPLVENAVVHGLEEAGEGGRIGITTQRLEDGTLQVAVEDNGIGMSAERLEEVRRSLDDTDEEKQHRIGLRNVHQRLKLTFGEDSGLKIESRENEGTSITFRLPGEEGNDHVYFSHRG